MVDTDDIESGVIWHGCAPEIATAIHSFLGLWDSFSLEARGRYSIFNLFRQIVDPAWQRYITSLPLRHLARRLVGDVQLSKVAQGRGFLYLIQSVDAWSHQYHVRLATSPGAHHDAGFVSALASLHSLCLMCQSKRSKHLTPTIHHQTLNARRGRPYCRLCGQPTEVSAAVANGVWPDANDRHYELKLSAKYCSRHRATTLKASSNHWNPGYKQATRFRRRFDEELLRLRAQSGSRKGPREHAGDMLIDQYVWLYTQLRGLYCADEAALRDAARKLVDSKITDQKKRVVVLLGSGITQAEAAKRLGLRSRQAVSKAIRSIPDAYHIAPRAGV